MYEQQYRDWLIELIRPGDGFTAEAIDILAILDSREYVYFNHFDSCRYADGQALIYRYADEYGYDRESVAMYFEPKTCSVLEMMIALSLRCEDTFTYDSQYGDRTYIWFWEMCKSLGLINQDNQNLTREERVDKFLSGDYQPNGSGGLFTIPSCGTDLRTVDLWTQLCWWLADRDI